MPAPGFSRIACATVALFLALTVTASAEDITGENIIILPLSFPRAVTDTYAIEENGALVVPAASGLLENDYHDAGLSFTVVLITDGADNGTLSVFGDGRFNYTPDEGFSGSDKFTYRIRDSGSFTDEATVTITVFPNTNRDPVGMDDLYFFRPGIQLTVPIAEGLLVNDRDPDGDDVTVSLILDGVDNGSLSVFTAGNFNYTPDANFTGEDSFVYRLRDDDGKTSSATVTLRSSNRGPEATTDYYGVVRNGTLTVPIARGVLYNDWDPDGNDLVVTLVTNGVDNGSLSLFQNGNFTYTPNQGFAGIDSFTYRIRDESGATANGQVQIWVSSEPAPLMFRNAFEFPLEP